MNKSELLPIIQAANRHSLGGSLLVAVLIASDGPVTQTQISDACEFSTASSTGVRDRLVKLGIFEECDAPAGYDRRAKLSRLTATGESVLHEILSTKGEEE